MPPLHKHEMNGYVVAPHLAAVCELEGVEKDIGCFPVESSSMYELAKEDPAGDRCPPYVSIPLMGVMRQLIRNRLDVLGGARLEQCYCPKCQEKRGVSV